MPCSGRHSIPPEPSAGSWPVAEPARKTKPSCPALSALAGPCCFRVLRQIQVAAAAAFYPGHSLWSMQWQHCPPGLPLLRKPLDHTVVLAPSPGLPHLQCCLCCLLCPLAPGCASSSATDLGTVARLVWTFCLLKES